jgi:hypothetical protein
MLLRPTTTQDIARTRLRFVCATISSSRALIEPPDRVRIERAGSRGLFRSNFEERLVQAGRSTRKMGRGGRRFFSATGGQREEEHDEARYDKCGPHQNN